MGIRGRLKIRLTCADISGAMDRLTVLGIFLEDVVILDALTLEFSVKAGDLNRVQYYARKHGAKLTVIARYGLLWTAKSLLRRPVLVLGLLLLMAVFLCIPGRIFILQVEGNQEVPSQRILEAAKSCGIRFGASVRQVRSERMKNELLSHLPQLQWAGVNTYGSRAVITVRERSREEQTKSGAAVSSIVASRDGVILSCTVTKGTGVVSVGQAVLEGQTLISGYTDCGICIRATPAEGEVIGETVRNLTVKTDPKVSIRVRIIYSRTKFSLQIGKKRINFYKGSGISDVSCVKMYCKYVLTLPGGFPLPVCLIEETEQTFVLEEEIRDENAVCAELTDFAQKYLRRIMIAGTVIGKEESFCADSGFSLQGQYRCQEMIGRVKPEEIGEYHGKTD